MVHTILEVQPRLGGGGGGKSNDDIVYELAESILEKIMAKLDIDNAKQEMFDVSFYVMKTIKYFLNTKKKKILKRI